MMPLPSTFALNVDGTTLLPAGPSQPDRARLSAPRVLPAFPPRASPHHPPATVSKARDPDSKTHIMSRRWVLTTSGFSPAGASFLAFRSFLMSAMGLRLSPRWKRLRARAVTSSMSWGVSRSRRAESWRCVDERRCEVEDAGQRSARRPGRREQGGTHLDSTVSKLLEGALLAALGGHVIGVHDGREVGCGRARSVGTRGVVGWGTRGRGSSGRVGRDWVRRAVRVGREWSSGVVGLRASRGIRDFRQRFALVPGASARPPARMSPGTERDSPNGC